MEKKSKNRLDQLKIWHSHWFNIRWRPNTWDIVALTLVIIIFTLLAWGGNQMSSPYQLGQTLLISLSPRKLPLYALLSVERMIIAMIFSLIFTVTLGLLAAKNRHAEKIIIPLVDILQSVPVLGFLSITISCFIALFPSSLLGPECAAIFAVFTAQVWNMILGFYQSLCTIPDDLGEAADAFHLSSWQRFWRLELPFALPNLIWNMMLSMATSWFFIVASEAITVNQQTILLRGIGSYIALALQARNKLAIVYAIIAMLIVIVLYDQLLFRPLVYWSERFKMDRFSDNNLSQTKRPWLVNLLLKTRLLHYLGYFLTEIINLVINIPRRKKQSRAKQSYSHPSKLLIIGCYSIVVSATVIATCYLGYFILQQLTIMEIAKVLVLGAYTAIRVVVLIIMCSLIWIPVGVWIAERPKVMKYAQPIVQILTAFPANLFFPLIVFSIIHFHLNIEIWVAPLMVLGAQWYILFNIMAGTSAIPKDLHAVSENFAVKGWLRWKRLILPAIFPFYVTGAITAAGGAWNASIVAEVVTWGNKTLAAQGLGAYIAKFTTAGDMPRIVLGIVIMCCYVLIFNHFIWRPLYNYSRKHYRLD